MIEMSESIGELSEALAKAQGEIKPAEKDSTNPHFRSHYASLASVWDACRAALSKNGLSIAQLPTITEGTLVLTTMLMHKSGQWIRSGVSVVPKDFSPQSIGSAVTYLRRYGLAAITGVVADEDDDGNEAQKKVSAFTPRTAPAESKPWTPTGDMCFYEIPTKHPSFEMLKDTIKRTGAKFQKEISGLRNVWVANQPVDGYEEYRVYPGGDGGQKATNIVKEAGKKNKQESFAEIGRPPEEGDPGFDADDIPF